jgi:maintenance of morphology protein 1
MLPNFTLDLKSTSLLGSRAKLADVPKLHELIDSQLRRALIRRGTLKIVLPGLSNVEDVKEVEPEREFTLD